MGITVDTISSEQRSVGAWAFARSAWAFGASIAESIFALDIKYALGGRGIVALWLSLTRYFRDFFVL